MVFITEKGVYKSFGFFLWFPFLFNLSFTLCQISQEIFLPIASQGLAISSQSEHLWGEQEFWICKRTWTWGVNRGPFGQKRAVCIEWLRSPTAFSLQANLAETQKSSTEHCTVKEIGLLLHIPQTAWWVTFVLLLQVILYIHETPVLIHFILLEVLILAIVLFQSLKKCCGMLNLFNTMNNFGRRIEWRTEQWNVSGCLNL